MCVIVWCDVFYDVFYDVYDVFMMCLWCVYDVFYDVCDIMMCVYDVSYDVWSGFVMCVMFYDVYDVFYDVCDLMMWSYDVCDVFMMCFMIHDLVLWCVWCALYFQMKFDFWNATNEKTSVGDALIIRPQQTAAFPEDAFWRLIDKEKENGKYLKCWHLTFLAGKCWHLTFLAGKNVDISSHICVHSGVFSN